MSGIINVVGCIIEAFRIQSLPNFNSVAITNSTPDIHIRDANFFPQSDNAISRLVGDKY